MFCDSVSNNFNVFIVSNLCLFRLGGPKALRRYKKLLLNRIQWNARHVEADDASNEEKPMDEEGNEDTKPDDLVENRCDLVWEVCIRSALRKPRIHGFSLYCGEAKTFRERLFNEISMIFKSRQQEQMLLLGSFCLKEVVRII